MTKCNLINAYNNNNYTHKAEREAYVVAGDIAASCLDVIGRRPLSISAKLAIEMRAAEI